MVYRCTRQYQVLRLSFLTLTLPGLCTDISKENITLGMVYCLQYEVQWFLTLSLSGLCTNISKEKIAPGPGLPMYPMHKTVPGTVVPHPELYGAMYS